MRTAGAAIDAMQPQRPVRRHRLMTQRAQFVGCHSGISGGGFGPFAPWFFAGVASLDEGESAFEVFAGIGVEVAVQGGLERFGGG